MFSIRLFFFYTSQLAYEPPAGSRRCLELFSIASVNELITYSFKLATLNAGGTSSFRSRSILKLKNETINSFFFARNQFFYSSSLINFGRTERN